MHAARQDSVEQCQDRKYPCNPATEAMLGPEGFGAGPGGSLQGRGSVLGGVGGLWLGEQALGEGVQEVSG